MSIISKIRNKSGLAITFIGISLGLFVISDAMQSNTSIFSGSSNPTDVGEVDGKSISIKEFEQELQKQEDNYKLGNPDQAIDDNTRTQFREQAWNTMLRENLMNKQYAELGLVVNNDELADLFYGTNIHPQVRQQFADPNTKEFNPANVLQNLKSINENGDEKIKAQLKQFEDYVLNETLNRKYSTLIKKGVYVTNLEAKQLYLARTQTAEMNYLAIPYSSISDSAIKVEEKELRTYFNKNSAKYLESENSLKLDFVVWDFAPSHEDSAEIINWANTKKEEFRSCANDTVFVDANSEVKFDITAKPRTSYPDEIASQLFKDSLGAVIGPIFKEGKFFTYKISGIKQDTIFYMRASHILFKVDSPSLEDTIKSMVKAGEILSKLRGGADFSAMAMEHGTDGTKDKGGDLGWFPETQMVREFTEACKTLKKGEMRLVKTQFGWHILKLTEDKTKKLICAGVIERTVKPSEKTSRDAFNDANQFAASSTSEKDFDANLEDKKLTKRTAETVRESDSYLPGFTDAREIVRWAFNAEKGDVSDVKTAGDKYIIAVVKDIRTKNKASFDASKSRSEADFIKDKKAEQLMEKVQTAMDGGATTLDALSKKLNATLNPIGAQSFDNINIAYVGPDNIFIGALFGSKPGNLNAPFKGESAVYAYTLNKINTAPEIKDYSQYKQELEGALKQRVEFSFLDALKEIKGVTDMRYKFY